MATNGKSINWDKEVDVVVVGFGAAGGISAITAHDAGAKVLLIEKMPHPGGISILSGGGVAFAHSAEGAFQYLKRSCNGTTPDDILRKMAEEMVGMIPWVTELAKVSGTEPTKTETRGHGTYPFPGTNEIDSIKLKDFQAYEEFPWAKGLRGGARLFKVVYDNVAIRKIETWLSSPAKELIMSPDAEVIGLKTEHDGKVINIKANKGVILACGGYENDDAMKLQYFEAQPVYPVYLGNTGDGVKMAQKAGAGLWHMWHFHGGYGFKFAELPFAIRHVWAGPRNENRKMIWVPKGFAHGFYVTSDSADVAYKVSDVVANASVALGRQQVARRGGEELAHSVVVPDGRVRDVIDDVGAGHHVREALARDGVDAGRGRGRHRVVSVCDKPVDDVAADAPGSADDHDLHDVPVLSSTRQQMGAREPTEGSLRPSISRR
jgi:hypothetical protein